ncbi:MAG: ABC transporter permease [Bifidobacteriaceae bacterium]|jgi:multidrug/hemolysin transport system permease protein|nr:ABC transporter permease [Bifidobacteriaceae bacterium]
MGNVIVLMKRTSLLFLRDKAAVFSSFLSTGILIALYFLFIGQMYTAGMTLENGFPMSGQEKSFLVYVQMMAGVVILNSVSVSVGVFSNVAKDFETRRTEGFMLTPATAGQILTAYFLSGMTVSWVLSALAWVVGVVLIGALTSYWLGFAAVAIGLGIAFAAALVSGALMLLLAALVRSSTALGVISGILGTFLGFLCGIYMPYFMLGNGIEGVGSVLPFTHLTVWFKQVVLGDAAKQLGISGAQQMSVLEESFSAENVGLLGLDLPLPVMLGLSGLFAVGCAVAALAVLRRRVRA